VKPEPKPGIQTDRAPRKRGRKPASQSGAVEIRTRLLAWKKTPELQRISLRAMAAKLGTSHQLLAFYLKGLKKWHGQEHQRKAKAIRERAWAENRGTTAAEEQQSAALDRAGFQLIIESALDSAYKRYEREFREMQPSALRGDSLSFIKILARHGVPFAKELLQQHQINLPEVRSHVSKYFRLVRR
jgi:hypothetical protein